MKLFVVGRGDDTNADEGMTRVYEDEAQPEMMKKKESRYVQLPHLNYLTYHLPLAKSIYKY